MTDDVRVHHPDYSAAKLSIMAARDCYLGERAVKARADLYLPRLTGQKIEEYAAYKMRATFYSIVSRTIAALTGLAVQGEVAVRGNDETLKQMKDAIHGLQLFESTNLAVAELLLQGRIGILLDAPEFSTTVGLYGYVSDAITNWDVDGSGRYVMVTLLESRTVTDPSNRFKKSIEDQYRVLELRGGVYTVSLYDKDSRLLKAVTPTFRGKTIDYIPFFTAMPDGLRAGVMKSPMEDMVAINMSHYRTSADLEHGRHFVGLPTPVITGSEVQGKMKIGGTAAWVLPEKEAKAFYMEFKGEGLSSLEKALQEKEAQLSSLSSSVISRSIRGSESPDAIRLRMSSETASLYTIVKTVQALTNVVWNTKSKLEGNPDDIEAVFPTQFVSGNITADEIAKYSKVYLEGGMPLKDYVTILRRGGALAASRTDSEVESDLERIAKERVEAAEKAAEAKRKSTSTQP
jgi:hypothetical protein